MAKKSLDTSKGYLMAISSAIVFSTSAILISYLTQTYSVPPSVLAFWRDLFAVLTLVIVFRVFWPNNLKLEKQNLLLLAIYGFILAFYNIIWTTSVVMNGAAVSTVLVYVSPGIAAVLGKIFFDELLNWVTILAIFVGLFGIVLVSEVINSGVEQLSFFGIFIGVLAGIFWAVYGLLAKITIKRGVNPWTSLFYTFIFATIFLFLYSLIQGGIFSSISKPFEYLFWLQTNWDAWIILFILAAVPTVLGFGLINASLEHLPSGITYLIMSAEPSITILWAYIFLSERLSGMQIWGSVLIILGVIFLRLNELRMEKKNFRTVSR